MMSSLAFDIACGQALWRLQIKSPSRDSTLSLSADETRLAIPLAHAIEIREVGTGRVCGSLPLTRESRFATWSPDGTHLACESADGSVDIWEVSTGVRTTTFGKKGIEHESFVTRYVTYSGHTDPVNNVAWSPDGQTIASCSGRLNQGQDGADYSVRLWNVSTAEEIVVFSGHDDAVNRCQWSSDGQLLASVSGSVVSPPRDNSLRIWSSVLRAPLAVLRGHHKEVVDCCWSPDQRHIVTGAKDGDVRVWDVDAVRSMEAFAPDIEAIALSPNNRRIAARAGSNAFILDAATGDRLHELRGHGDDVVSFAWSPDGAHLVTGSKDRNLIVWSAETGEPIATLSGHHGERTYTAGGHRIEWGAVIQCAWTPDGHRIISASTDGSCRVWNPLNGKQLFILAAHRAPLAGFRLSRDGRRIVSRGGSFEHLSDRRALLWDLRLGILLGEVEVWPAGFAGAGSAVQSVRCEASRDESLFVNAGNRRGSTDAPRVDIVGPQGAVIATLMESAAHWRWSSDNQVLYAMDDNGVLRGWSTPSFEQCLFFDVAAPVADIAVRGTDELLWAEDGAGVRRARVHGIDWRAPVARAITLYDHAAGSWRNNLYFRCPHCAFECEGPAPGVSERMTCSNCTCEADVLGDNTNYGMLHGSLRPTQVEDAELWFGISAAMYDHGDPPEDIEHYAREALARNPDHLWSRLVLALARLKLSDQIEAARQLGAIRDARPQDKRLLNFVASAYDNLGKTQEAEAARHAAAALQAQNRDENDSATENADEDLD